MNGLTEQEMRIEIVGKIAAYSWNHTLSETLRFFKPEKMPMSKPERKAMKKNIENIHRDVKSGVIEITTVGTN